MPNPAEKARLIGSLALPLGPRSTGLWQQFQHAREAWTNAYRAEIAPVGSQYPIDLAPLGDSGHHSIDESQPELPEPGVKLKGTGNAYSFGFCISALRRRNPRMVFVELLGGNEFARRPQGVDRAVDV